MQSPESLDLRPGTIVDARYRVIERLGQGGMATVYRVEHLGMRREVALKVLDLAAAPDALVRRFEREARAVARLDHAGCVRVFDYGRSLGRHYLAMELLEGPTLSDELAIQPRLSPVLAVNVARQILDGLAHAHANGVLHRDVKPANVMYGRRGAGRRLVLIDFGLARLSDEGPLTAAGVCAGSPSYIPPERLAGQAYDARADVYAVGVILYEMLAGRRPIVGSSAKEIARRTLYEGPTPLRVLAPHVPQELAELVMRALAREPTDRFRDATALRAALDQVRADCNRALGASPPPSPVETTFLEVDFVRPSLWRRFRRWLRPGRAEGTVDITSAA